MPFRDFHRKPARQELNNYAKRLGADFLPSVETWLQALADEAELGEYRSSSDVGEFLEQLAAENQNFKLKTGFERWLAEAETGTRRILWRITRQTES